MRKGLAAAQDVTRHVALLAKRLASAWDDTGPEPGGSQADGRAQLSPQSAPFSGGNCQSAASHIAPSLKLIAIVNPRDQRGC